MQVTFDKSICEMYKCAKYIEVFNTVCYTIIVSNTDNSSRHIM